MRTRSAVSTIAGYFYQFDHSILSLLNLKDELDTVSLECIEDIDVKTTDETTAIQCKYYAQTEYNHSVIKPTIELMLSHFVTVKATSETPTYYKIWGHFSGGQHKLVFPISLDYFRKNFLTSKKDGATRNYDSDLGINDESLIQFLELLTIDINAKDIDSQQVEVIDIIQKHFDCSPFQAGHFYYNNALRVIRELSIRKDPAGRTISRKDFLKSIDTSVVLFHEWFIAKKGEKAHYDALRKAYFSSLNVSPFERFFMVEVVQNSYDRQELKNVLFAISKKYSRTKKHEPNPFCPYVYIHGIQEVELIALKNELISEGFTIVDGYDYKGSGFSPMSIHKQANHANGIRLKILNSLSDLEEALSLNTKTRKLYQFYHADPYCSYTADSVEHIKIQLPKFSDITRII